MGTRLVLQVDYLKSTEAVSGEVFKWEKLTEISSYGCSPLRELLQEYDLDMNKGVGSVRLSELEKVHEAIRQKGIDLKDETNYQDRDSSYKELLDDYSMAMDDINEITGIIKNAMYEQDVYNVWEDVRITPIWEC